MTENSKKPIPVLVSGALGRMGSEVVNTVLNSTELTTSLPILPNAPETSTGMGFLEFSVIFLKIFFLKVVTRYLYCTQ